MEISTTPPTWKAWLYATRPRTLSAAVVPMVVGSAFAYMAKGGVSYALTACAIVAAVLIQIGTNLVNDALDYKKGADTAKRLGPKRATASGWLPPARVLAIGIAMLAISVIAAIPLIVTGGWPIFWTVSISAVMGYLYTGGPKPLSYNGLGDLFVFIFFGLIATGAMYFIQTGELSWEVMLAATQVGMSATLLIAINNLRDIEEDTKTEKRTLAVRFGKEVARHEITFLTFAPYLLCWVWWEAGYHALAFWPLTTIPLALTVLINVKTHEPNPAYNIFLGQASILHLLMGLTLTAGALL